MRIQRAKQTSVQIQKSTEKCEGKSLGILDGLYRHLTGFGYKIDFHFDGLSDLKYCNP